MNRPAITHEQFANEVRNLIYTISNPVLDSFTIEKVAQGITDRAEQLVLQTKIEQKIEQPALLVWAGKLFLFATIITMTAIMAGIAVWIIKGIFG